MKNINITDKNIRSNNGKIKDFVNIYWDRVSESVQSRFPIKENIESSESIEKIRNAFSFYKNGILPVILDNPNVTQKIEWYHGLFTHTENVVFRGICYAVSLGEDPIPVVFACACHDLARKNDSYDTKHWKNAVPIAQEIMNNEKFNLTDVQKEQIIDAIANHTEWKQTSNYVSACLRDADRTRLSWERWYRAEFFNTEQWKKIASWKREDFIKFQNQCVNLEWKDPKTITPEEFNLILMNRDDLGDFKKNISSLEALLLYDKIIENPRIQKLGKADCRQYFEHLFWIINRWYCDLDACLEIIPSLLDEWYDLNIVSNLSIRDDNKSIIKLLLNDSDIIKILDVRVANEINEKERKSQLEWKCLESKNEESTDDWWNWEDEDVDSYEKIEKDYKEKLSWWFGKISKFINDDNVKYLKDCLELNIDVTWLPYFREDTKDIVLKYLSWYEDYSWKLWVVLDRIHRRWHTLQSISNIFGDEPIKPLTERLLEFKDFDKFKNIWVAEYKNLSIEDKKLFLNGFISALTPSDIKYPEQSRWDEDFKNLQDRMKIFSEINWENDVKPSWNEANIEIRDRRLKKYNDILKILLDWIPDNERVAPTYKWPSNIHYRKKYRERNKIPPLVDDLEKVLDIHTENIRWRTIKVAEVGLKTDLWICTHTFISILSVEALEITDSQMFLAVWNNWCWRERIPTFKGKGWYYNLLLKPRKIDDMYVQASCDIDSWNWSMKNLYNFEHIMLPSMWDNLECISLVPNAIKQELNLSQEEYTKRINALWNVTTLQEVWEKDKELELGIRRALNKISVSEWLVTPTVMWITIWKKNLNDVDDDILDYCVRRDIPLVKIKYPVK